MYTIAKLDLKIDNLFLMPLKRKLAETGVVILIFIVGKEGFSKYFRKCVYRFKEPMDFLLNIFLLVNIRLMVFLITESYV